MDPNKVIDYYKNHSNLDTRKKFGITYRELKQICSRENFIKSKEQIRETYMETKRTKYGSLDKAYEVMVQNKNDTVLKNYGSYDLYYEIRANNNRKTNRKKFGVDYPMQNTEVVEKSNTTKRRKHTSYESDV